VNFEACDSDPTAILKWLAIGCMTSMLFAALPNKPEPQPSATPMQVFKRRKKRSSP